MSIIKSFSVGNGDMYYIDHNSDNFTTIDCCYCDEEDKNNNFEEIKRLASRKGITRFISTHPDDDHIKGIEDYQDIVGIYNFYCVENNTVKQEKTDSFKKYCELRDSDIAYYVYKGCKRLWQNQENKERGSSRIEFLWPDINNNDFKDVLEKVKNGEQCNNISPVFTYSAKDGVVAMWMGDLEHDFLEKIKDEIEWPEIDILFAPHHGRKTGKVSEEVLKKLNPKIIIIGEAPSEHLNYYCGYNTITQNTAGDVVFDCNKDFVDVYITNENYSYDTSFLKNRYKTDCYLGCYLGTFVPKKAER